MRRGLRTLAVCGAVLALGAPVAAQDAPLLVAPAERGIVLRWVWPEGARPAGYFVERRPPGGTWTRLTPTPLRRLRDRAAARTRLGPAFDRYVGLLFPDDSAGERADAEMMRGLLLLSADLEPAVADVLGLRYDDAAAAAGAAYEYRLVALTNAGERVVAVSAAVTAGGYRPAAGPANVRAVAGPRGAALRWDAAARFSAYHVYRGTRADASDARRLNDAPVVIFVRDDGATIEASPTFFTDTAPPRDSAWYWVEGVDAFGRSSRRSEPARFAPRVVAALAAPFGVAARVQDDTVVVTWLPLPDTAVTEYHLWRADSDTGPYTRLGSRPARALLEYRDAGRPARRPSWYRVTARDRAGRESEQSPAALAEVPDLAAPPTPTELVGSADTGRLSLRWRPVTANDLRGYRVYRAATPDGTFGLLSQTPQRAAAFTDTVPVRADHPFYYRVTAVDSAFNESVPSAVVAVRPPDVTAPAAPQIRAIRPLDQSLGVAWLPNPEPDVVAYRMRYRAAGDAEWLEAPAATPAGMLADTIAGLVPGRVYQVSLVAVDDAGNRSAPAPVVEATPVRRGAPARPELRRVAWDRAAGGAALEWARPAAGVAAVLVLRREGDQAWRPIAELPATATRFVDRLARAGRRYEYLVRVRDAFGNSADSRPRRLAVPEAQP